MDMVMNQEVRTPGVQDGEESDLRTEMIGIAGHLEHSLGSWHRRAETHSMLHTAAKLKRLSFGMRLLSLLPDPAGRKPDKPWGGVCVLENCGEALTT
jgi:hypothetical protein